MGTKNSELDARIRFFLIVILVATCLSGAPYPSTVSAQDTKFDVNDVSYLWPVPRNAADIATLIAATDSIGENLELWPKDIFETVLATAQTISVEDSAGRPNRIEFDPSFRAGILDRRNWKVVAFRVDPCAPGCDDAFRKTFGAAPQIRLILQPVVMAQNGGVVVHDIAAHLVFNFTDPTARPFVPDRAAFSRVVQDLVNLQQMARKAGVNTEGPLRVHPALMENVTGFSEATKNLIKTRLSPQRLFAIAFMGLAPAPEPWIFFSMAKDPASGRFVAVPQGPLGKTPAQMLSFRGGTHVMPVPIATNLGGGQGVSTAALFEGDVQSRLDVAVLEGQLTPTHRSVPQLIANPKQAHFFNTDCVSCHTETTRRRLLGIKTGAVMFEFVRPPGTSGVDEGHLPNTLWNVRNFGWFQGRPGQPIVATISQRTGNEAAESANQITLQYLNANETAAGNSAVEPRITMAKPVASPLTLVMKIKSQSAFVQLKGLLDKIQSLPADQNPITLALNRIGTVHFARFVFIEERFLAVITTYDGSFDDYIDAFVNEIGKVFDQLLAHVDSAPPLPVAEHRDEFLAFVKKHDLQSVGPFYSAYPNLKTLDVLTLERNATKQR